MESVNSATVKQALAESMVQLGNCVQRLIALLADNYDPANPFKFAKLDKYGFWRLATNKNADAWNFMWKTPCWSSQTACRWAGANHRHSFVQHQKQQGM
jgi:hypothetical protein